ncbi:hypothetical protein [Paraburkholderia phenoliruptrix]|uniref:hypothetical protein n=1 Tax=Paraburkholderia phenoliruptrix TaxID=252970 RepID=UPI002869A03D|nr:hypothetical protein [Paraburkholderia phenoliruptrix]WMY11092.1 hypothetical protein P3F88_31030 [Paraburkholderia phenoliruptrix]
MAINLKALLKRATPLSDERAEALISADMLANAHRYPPAAASSEPMEAELDPAEELIQRQEGKAGLRKL